MPLISASSDIFFGRRSAISISVRLPSTLNGGRSISRARRSRTRYSARSTESAFGSSLRAPLIRR